jgi:protein TonB
VATRVLESIDVSALPEPLQGIVREKVTVFEGKEFTRDLLRELFDALRQVDSHLVARPLGSAGASPGVALRVQLIDSSAAPPPPAATQQVDFPPTPGVGRIKVDREVQARKRISMARPVYPTEARKAHVQGMVRFAVLVGTDGHIANIQLVSGHPLLVPAAQESVAQWVYEPSLVNGQPVEVQTQVDVNFTLSM